MDSTALARHFRHINSARPISTEEEAPKRLKEYLNSNLSHVENWIFSRSQPRDRNSVLRELTKYIDNYRNEKDLVRTAMIYANLISEGFTFDTNSGRLDQTLSQGFEAVRDSIKAKRAFKAEWSRIGSMDIPALAETKWNEESFNKNFVSLGEVCHKKIIMIEGNMVWAHIDPEYAKEYHIYETEENTYRIPQYIVDDIRSKIGSFDNLEELEIYLEKEEITERMLQFIKDKIEEMVDSTKFSVDKTVIEFNIDYSEYIKHGSGRRTSQSHMSNIADRYFHHPRKFIKLLRAPLMREGTLNHSLMLDMANTYRNCFSDKDNIEKQEVFANIFACFMESDLGFKVAKPISEIQLKKMAKLGETNLTNILNEDWDIYSELNTYVKNNIKSESLGKGETLFPIIFREYKKEIDKLAEKEFGNKANFWKAYENLNFSIKDIGPLIQLKRKGNDYIKEIKGDIDKLWKLAKAVSCIASNIVNGEFNKDNWNSVVVMFILKTFEDHKDKNKNLPIHNIPFGQVIEIEDVLKLIAEKFGKNKFDLKNEDVPRALREYLRYEYIINTRTKTVREPLPEYGDPTGLRWGLLNHEKIQRDNDKFWNSMDETLGFEREIERSKKCS